MTTGVCEFDYHQYRGVLGITLCADFTPVFCGVRVPRSLVFCVVFCRSLFVLLAIVLSVLLQFTDSDYLFKLFFDDFRGIV